MVDITAELSSEIKEAQSSALSWAAIVAGSVAAAAVPLLLCWC
jgi:hypothetical protein